MKTIKTLTIIAAAFLAAAVHANEQEFTTTHIALFLATQTDAVMACPGLNTDYIEENNAACFSYGTWVTNDLARAYIELEILKYTDAAWLTPWHAGGESIARKLVIAEQEFWILIHNGNVIVFPPDQL